MVPETIVCSYQNEMGFSANLAIHGSMDGKVGRALGHHFRPDWNIFPTDGWIAVKLVTHFHVSVTMNCNNSGNPFTFN